jgi:hypothetical protein
MKLAIVNKKKFLDNIIFQYIGIHILKFWNKYNELKKYSKHFEIVVTRWHIFEKWHLKQKKKKTLFPYMVTIVSKWNIFGKFQTQNF